MAPRVHSSQILTQIRKQFLLLRSDIHGLKRAFPSPSAGLWYSSAHIPWQPSSPRPPAGCCLWSNGWHLSQKRIEYPQPKRRGSCHGSWFASSPSSCACALPGGVKKVVFGRALGALPTLAVHPRRPPQPPRSQLSPAV